MAFEGKPTSKPPFCRFLVLVLFLFLVFSKRTKRKAVAPTLNVQWKHRGLGQFERRLLSEAGTCLWQGSARRAEASALKVGAQEHWPNLPDKKACLLVHTKSAGRGGGGGGGGLTFLLEFHILQACFCNLFAEKLPGTPDVSLNQGKSAGPPPAAPAPSKAGGGKDLWITLVSLISGSINEYWRRNRQSTRFPLFS